jgi:hypothetical protein
MTEEEVVLADGGRREGVGLDDVRAGLEIMAMNFLDDGRLGDLEEFVVALEILAGPVLEPVTAELGFTELVPLDDRAHGTVDDDDALFQERDQTFASRVTLTVGRTHKIPRENTLSSHGNKEQINSSGFVDS